MLAGAIAGCQESLADVDGVFYDGDGRLVHCGVDLDEVAGIGIADIDGALDRARDRSEVVELYAHNPGKTVPLDKLEYVLSGAVARGLAFVTYADFANRADTAPGLALSFDDTFIDPWFSLRPMLQRYRARVTFFVSRYHVVGPEQRDKLKMLAADGHAIEAHSVQHLRAPDYVERNGLNAYLRNEVDPSIAILRDDGFTVDAFAYPYGARTSELDKAIGKRVPVIRSVAFAYHMVEGPCPH